MKIIVTGSAGFIGYHLSKSLVKDGYEVLGIDNINDYYDQKLKNDRLDKLLCYDNFNFTKVDITDKASIMSIFKSFEPQKVVNLAAQAGVRYSFINPDAYINSNLLGFVNIIESCKKYNVEGLVYASSSSLYGANSKTPFAVNHRVDKPISLYGVTKRANELIAYTYSNLYNLHTTGLRYFTVYGSWYRPDMAMFIFINNIIDGKTINVFSNGKIKRDFTYIDDIIIGTKSAIAKNYKNEIFNLGSGKSEDLINVIALIEEKLGKSAILKFLPNQLGDLMETCADIEYSKEKINYLPKTTIKKGIPRLINWYKEYYHV